MPRQQYFSDFFDFTHTPLQDGLWDHSQASVFEGFNIDGLEEPQDTELQSNPNSQMMNSGSGQDFGWFDSGLEDLHMDCPILASNTPQSQTHASPPVQSQSNLGPAPPVLPAPSLPVVLAVTPRKLPPRFRERAAAQYTRENAEKKRICTLCRKAKKKVSPSNTSNVCTWTCAKFTSAQGLRLTNRVNDARRNILNVRRKTYLAFLFHSMKSSNGDPYSLVSNPLE